MYRFLPSHLTDRLDALSVALRQPLPGGMQGLHRSRHHGSSVEFADYRPYAPGDPPERIDWAVYARSDRHLIRRTEDETRLTAHLLLDTSASMGFGRRGGPTKLEHACALAAATAYVLVRQGDAVQVHPFAARPEAGPPPASSRDGLRPLLLALEGLAAAGVGDPAAAMHAFAAGARRRGLVVLLSDLLRPATEIVSAVAHLTHAGHQVALLQILDRDELSLPWHGVVEMTDLETGRRAVVEVDAVRAAYGRAVARHLDDLRRGAAGLGSLHHLVETGTPVDATLRDALRIV